SESQQAWQYRRQVIDFLLGIVEVSRDSEQWPFGSFDDRHLDPMKLPQVLAEHRWIGIRRQEKSGHGTAECGARGRRQPQPRQPRQAGTNMPRQFADGGADTLPPQALLKMDCCGDAQPRPRAARPSNSDGTQPRCGPEP